MPARPVPAPLQIGLLNNMPDAALAQTERQWTRLLQAAGGSGVRVRLFALKSLRRSAATRERMQGAYRPAAELPGAGLDAVVVTGAEPRAADLRHEPFWDELAEAIDWASAHAGGAVFSCLAAHAAVLRLDGVPRRSLPAKLSGVFATKAGAGAWVAGPGSTPHSRANDLAEADLSRAGYAVLTRGEAIGVDAFTRPGRAPQLFLQGHPEYEADTLAREYLRDVGRLLRGERTAQPDVPIGYMSAEIEAALKALARERPRPRLSAYAATIERAALAEPWREPAVALFERWLDAVEEARPRLARTPAERIAAPAAA